MSLKFLIILNQTYLQFCYYILSNRFVGSLIASDLLSSAVLGPLLVSDVKHVNKALIVFVATSTIFSILVIAMDRYTAVLSPLHYATNVTRQKSALGKYIIYFLKTNNLIAILQQLNILLTNIM